MKILHILATPRAEGTPNLVLDWLTTGLHEQEVFSLDCRPSDLTDRLRAAARWYGEEDAGLLQGWRKFPSIMVRVREVCLERKPDVLICWVMGLAAWVCLGAKLAGVRQVFAHAGNPPNRGVKHDLLTVYTGWVLGLTRTRVICCSRYVRDQFRDVPWVPASLFFAVHNCCRIREVRERAGNARATRTTTGLCAIMVATLEDHKDHETLLLALPKVLQAHPAFQMRLAGDGSLRAHLQERVQQMGLDHAVTFLGSRGDVPELLGQSDLFVFSTTDQEGLGSVLLEALAAGLPIVASDVPACRELLEDGRRGILVPARDPESLAQAIIDTLEIVPDNDGWTKDVDEYLGHFTPQVMMAKYLSLDGR